MKLGPYKMLNDLFDDIVMKEENLSMTKRYMNFLKRNLKDIGI